MPFWGPVSTQFKAPIEHSRPTRGGVAALKLEEVAGKWQLAPAWLSRDMDLAEETVVANGIVFVYSSGVDGTQVVQDAAWNEPGGPRYGGALSSGAARRIPNSRKAMLYALDGRTGRELWNSGDTMARAAAGTGVRADSETRWILVPVSGSLAGVRTTNGAIRNGAVVALRVADVNGTLSLEPEWTSNDLMTPATPIIVNGVVFALSTGRPAAAGRTGSPAVLYAYEGGSGKALWNSGKSMTTSASPGSYWSALSQVYVGGADGTVYAFGFLDERR